MADEYRPRITEAQSDYEQPEATVEHVKCPVCKQPMKYDGRHVTGPWDNPPRPTQVDVFLVCTCKAPEGFKLE